MHAQLPLQLIFKVCKAISDDQVKQTPLQASSALRPIGSLSTLTHLGHGPGTTSLAHTSCDIVILAAATSRLVTERLSTFFRTFCSEYLTVKTHGFQTVVSHISGSAAWRHRGNSTTPSCGHSPASSARRRPCCAFSRQTSGSNIG